MKISELLPSKIERNGTSNQWQDLIGRFVESYNNGTVPKYYMTPNRMSAKLSPLLKVNGIGWLEWFYEDCKKKDNFGRYFNYSLSSKNVK